MLRFRPGAYSCPAGFGFMTDPRRARHHVRRWCSAAVSGGVRRTAMISLFDYDDHGHASLPRTATSGFTTASAGTPTTPRSGPIGSSPSRRSPASCSTWSSPAEASRVSSTAAPPSKTGPPGAEAPSSEPIPAARSSSDRISSVTSPAPSARADDTPETLKEKVELATIIGTIQSMATLLSRDFGMSGRRTARKSASWE
jgi:ribonucleoside-triphosphate reductase